MEEFARVAKILDGNMAEVELQAHSACSSCGKCAHGQPKKDRYTVNNPINARVGDIVVLEMETGKVLSAVLLIYLLPLVNLLIGYGLGLWINTTLNIWPGEGLAILSGLLFMGLTFLFIRNYDNKLGQRTGFKPQIKRIVSDYDII